MARVSSGWTPLPVLEPKSPVAVSMINSCSFDGANSNIHCSYRRGILLQTFFNFITDGLLRSPRPVWLSHEKLSRQRTVMSCGPAGSVTHADVLVTNANTIRMLRKWWSKFASRHSLVFYHTIRYGVFLFILKSAESFKNIQDWSRLIKNCWPTFAELNQLESLFGT